MQLLQSTHDARISRMDAKEEVLPPLSSINSSHAARSFVSLMRRGVPVRAAGACESRDGPATRVHQQEFRRRAPAESEPHQLDRTVRTALPHLRRDCRGAATEATHTCAERLLQLRRVCAGTSRAQRPKSRKRSRRMRATSARRSTACCFSASGESRSVVAAEWPSWR